MKTLTLTLIFWLYCLTTISAQTPVIKLEPSEFKKKIEGKTVQIIDIRTPPEFAKGHIENAQNIDYYSTTFYNDMDKFDKKQALYIYCRSGNRTLLATSELQKLGFTVIYELKSGINGWQSANLPIVK